VRESGYRDDFFLKLLAASRLGAADLDRVLRVQREAYLQELASLGELRARYADDPLVGLLVEAAVLHTEANVRVIELAERSRKALTARRPAEPKREAAPATEAAVGSRRRR
jgi:Virulence activator alpha C-term